jgi:HD-GYP domain-containing protein (c-di-GMP phosphodiesterase class II)
MSEDPRPASRPRDERLREHGLGIIMRFLALVRIGRSYQVENRVFHQQLAIFVESLGPVFAEAPEAVLVSLDSDLYLNGVRIPVKTANLRFHQALMDEFSRRGVAGVRILDSITEAQLEGFFRFFLQPDVYHGTSLLEACMAEGMGRILPVVRASTESGDLSDPFDPVTPNGFATTSGVDPVAGFGAPGTTGPETGHAGGRGQDPVSGAASARPATHKNYSLAFLGTRSLLTTTALQDGMELHHAKRVVQPLIDGAFADEPVVVGLSSLSHHDEYTYAHSVNVCIVAVTMGHFLGLDRRALADLGVAALLHDVGKAAVYDRIRHPLEEMDEEERRLADSHPLEGAKLIARSTALNASTLRCMRVALEHHAARAPQGNELSRSPAGSAGYPLLPAGWRMSQLSGIVSAADCFVSLQMHRSPRGASITPYQALGMMLGPLADRFDPVMLWALVSSVGFYPPGQLVELSDGRTAVVLAPDKQDLARPHVRVIMDECGVPFSPVEAKELRPLPASLSVTRALAAHEYPEVPQAA